MTSPADWIKAPGTPALHVEASNKTMDSGSYFGGWPKVHDAMEWPHYNGRALEFLACLDLAQVQAHLPTPWLPNAGQLLFFFDVQEQPWGFDPTERDGWRVLFMPAGATLAERVGPGEPYPKRGMKFRPIETYPEGLPDTHGVLSDSELDALHEYVQQRNYKDLPCHQVGGLPHPVQGSDMEIQCELTCHGIYTGSGNEFDTPHSRALMKKGGQKDWKLLLQIDTDDDPEGGWMWGDMGMLYFWVRASQARQGRFEDAWCILQCC